jgi:hypothetical protein
MRQIHDVLRLCFAAKLPQRAVARSLGLSQGAVRSVPGLGRPAEADDAASPYRW